MDIGKFITNYTKSNSQQIRDEMIKKHVVATYVPYETKISESLHIVDTSCYKTVNDKKMFWIDSPMRYILFMKAIVMLYTDLEFDTTNAMIQFNLLEQYNIFEKIIECIGADYEKFQAVLNMTLDDRMANERSLLSYLENMGKAAGMVADKIVETLPNILEQIEIE